MPRPIGEAVSLRVLARRAAMRPAPAAAPHCCELTRRRGCRAPSSLPLPCSKVAVLGAGGGIGQPLSLLLKMNRLVSELSLYDVANVAGVAADLSHCNTPTQVRAVAGLLSWQLVMPVP